MRSTDGIRRRAGHLVLSVLPMLVAACGDPQPAAKQGVSGAGISMMVLVRPANDPCGAAPATFALRDAAGVGWWMEGKRWCRAANGAQPAQAWVSDAADPRAKRLVIEGQRLSLLAPEVRLRPVADAPAPAPFVGCGPDARSRVFAAENRLRDPGDLACGRTFAGPGFRLTTAGFAGTGSTMPALVTTPAKPAMGTIVYLFGGPYENLPAGLVARSTSNHLLAQWAGRAAIVIPAYLGIDRIRTGAGDATRARAEVDALLTALERRGPVCVIGFSLGGPIAAASVAGHPEARFLLAAPLATSPARFVARAIAQGRPLRPITLSSPAPDGQVLTLRSDKAYLDYFAGSENRDLAALLGPGRHPNLRVAYARGDIPVLRRDLAPVAPMLAADAIHELPAAIGHSIETPFGASAYRPLIDDFLADCLGSPD